MRWRLVGPDEAEAGWSEPFADREGAEAWLGATWFDLAERGVEQVELQDGTTGEVVYRMSLGEG